MIPEIKPYKLHRKEKMDGIKLVLSRHKKELPKINLSRVTDPLCTNQWVTVSNEDKKIISAGRVVKSGMNKWIIKDLVTDNMYRGKGIASDVVDVLVKKAIRGGAKVIETNVSYDNVPVKKIFENLGFKEDEHKKRLSDDDIRYVFYPQKKERTKLKTYTPSLYRF